MNDEIPRVHRSKSFDEDFSFSPHSLVFDDYHTSSLFRPTGSMTHTHPSTLANVSLFLCSLLLYFSFNTNRNVALICSQFRSPDDGLAAAAANTLSPITNALASLVAKGPLLDLLAINLAGDPNHSEEELGKDRYYVDFSSAACFAQ